MKKIKHIGLMMISAFALLFSASYNIANLSNSPIYNTNYSFDNTNEWKSQNISDANFDLNANYNRILNEKLGYQGSIISTKIWFEMPLYINNIDDVETTYSFVNKENAIATRIQNRKNKTFQQNAVLRENGKIESVVYDGETLTDVEFWSETDLNNCIIEGLTGKSEPYFFVKIKGQNGKGVKVYAIHDENYKEPAYENDANAKLKQYYLTDSHKPAEAYEGENMAELINYDDKNYNILIVNNETQSFQLNSLDDKHLILVITPHGNEIIEGKTSKEFNEIGLYPILEVDQSKEDTTKLWYCYLASNKIDFKVENDENDVIKNSLLSSSESVNFVIKDVSNPPKLIFNNIVYQDSGLITCNYYIDNKVSEEEPTEIYHIEGNEGLTFERAGKYHIYYSDKAGNKFEKVCFVSTKESEVELIPTYIENGDKFRLDISGIFPEYETKRPIFSSFKICRLMYEPEEKIPSSATKCIDEKPYTEVVAEHPNLETVEGFNITYGNPYQVEAKYGWYVMLLMDSNSTVITKGWHFQYIYEPCNVPVITNYDDIKSLKFGEIHNIEFSIYPKAYKDEDRIEFDDEELDPNDILRVNRELDSEGKPYYEVMACGIGTAKIVLYVTDYEGNRIHTDARKVIEITIVEPILDEMFFDDHYIRNGQIYIPKFEIDYPEFSYYNQTQMVTPSLINTFTLNGNLGPQIKYKNVKDDLKNRFETLWLERKAQYLYEEGNNNFKITVNPEDTPLFSTTYREGYLCITQCNYGSSKNPIVFTFLTKQGELSKSMNINFEYDDVVIDEKHLEQNAFDYDYQSNIYKSEDNPDGILNKDIIIENKEKRSFLNNTTVSIINGRTKQGGRNPNYFNAGVHFEYYNEEQGKKILTLDSDKTSFTTTTKIGTTKLNVVLDRENTGNRYEKNEKGEYVKISNEGKIVLSTIEITNTSLITNDESFTIIGSRNANGPTLVTSFNISLSKKVHFTNDIDKFEYVRGDKIINILSTQDIESNGNEGTGYYNVTLLGSETPQLVEINTFKEVEHATCEAFDGETLDMSSSTLIDATKGIKYVSSDENFKMYIRDGEKIKVLSNGEEFIPNGLVKEGEYKEYSCEFYKQIVDITGLDLTEEEINRYCYLRETRNGTLDKKTTLKVSTAIAKVKQNNWWIGLTVGICAGGIAIVIIIFLVRKVKKKYQVQNM